MTEVLIVAVIYNTYKETLRFLKSIEQQKFKDLEIVLVDNSDHAFEDNFEIQLKNYSLTIHYFKSEKNLGYFGGAAYGLKKYLKTINYPEWVIVCNVDIVYDQEEFFKKLTGKNYDSRTGVIAPSIISRKWKTDTNPKIVKRYTREQMNFYLAVVTNRFTQNAYMTLSYFKKLVLQLKNKLKTNQQLNKHQQPIYAPHGSCIILNQRYFKLGGNLNSISFLFGEEIFVAETLIKLNLQAVYDPGLKVSDYEHASTGFFYSKKIAGYMKQSTIDIIKNYYQE